MSAKSSKILTINRLKFLTLVRCLKWTTKDIVDKISNCTKTIIDSSTIEKYLRGITKNPSQQKIRAYVKTFAIVLNKSEGRIEKFLEYQLIPKDELETYVNNIEQKISDIQTRNLFLVTNSNSLNKKEATILQTKKETNSNKNILNEYCLLSIQDKYGFQEVIIEKKSISMTNHRIVINSSFDYDISRLLQTPLEAKTRIISNDSYRWIKILNNYDFILGKLIYCEGPIINHFLLSIEKQNKESSNYSWDRNQITEIRGILNILLFNKMASHETAIDNPLRNYAFEKGSVRDILYNPLHASPICPIPSLYKHFYIEKKDWKGFYLNSMYYIIETLEFLNFIDIIENFEIVKKGTDKIEIIFSAILHLEYEIPFGPRIDLKDECDLSLANKQEFDKSLSIGSK